MQKTNPPDFGPAITDLSDAELEVMYRRHREYESFRSEPSENLEVDPFPRLPVPSLPIDDGRSQREQWPWRRYDDHTPHIRWFRWMGRALLFAGAGAAGTYMSGSMVPLAVGLLGTALVGILGPLNDWLVPWPAWRVRNLEAANFRANESLKLVDPEFGRHMSSDGRMYDPIRSETGPIGPGSFRGPIPTCGDFNPHVSNGGWSTLREDIEDPPL